MNTTSNKTWLYIGIVIVAVLLFFPKLFKKLTGGSPRRRHRVVRSVNSHRRRVRYAITGSSRRPARRSRTRTRRNKGAKPAWMVKGSRAARLRMAKIRRLRRKH